MGRNEREGAGEEEESQPCSGRSFSYAEDETRCARRRPESPAAGIRSKISSF